MPENLSNFFPFLNWVHNIKKHLRTDILAGISVAVILIPQSLAYAQIAGLPAYFGLYAGLLPVIIAALWGSSRFVSTGPVVVVSLLTYSALSLTHEPGSIPFIKNAITLALLVGLIQIGFGVLKLGQLINFVSHSVILGFTNAAALIIALSQFPKLFGFSIDRHQHILLSVVDVFQNLNHMDHLTFIIGFSATAIIIISRKYIPKVPIVLLVVIATTLFSWLTGYQGAIVGDIPQGLPSLVIPSFANIDNLILPALIISLVAYMEALSVGKSLAAKSRTSIDPNQEFIGQGLANLSASFSGTYPVAGSFSRSAVNFTSGAKTGFSSIVTGLIIIITLLFFTPFLYYLPQATLAAVILAAVIKLINFRAKYSLIRLYKYDGIIAIITFVATLALSPHIDYGIIIGIACSAFIYAYRASHPPVLIFKANRKRFSNIHQFHLKDYPSNANVLIVSFDYSLIFTNAAYLKEKILTALKHYPKVKYVMIMSRGINMIDATASDVIEEMIQEFNAMNKHLYFVDIKHNILKHMRQSGLDKIIGKDHIFHSPNDALALVNKLEKKKTSK